MPRKEQIDKRAEGARGLEERLTKSLHRVDWKRLALYLSIIFHIIAAHLKESAVRSVSWPKEGGASFLTALDLKCGSARHVII